MTTIVISNDIRLSMSGIPKGLLRSIMDDLTLDNPAYIQAVRHGFSTWGMEAKLKYFKVADDTLILPRGYGPTLSKLVKDYKAPVKWDDQRLTLPSVDFGSKIKLRSYQVPAVEALVKMRCGSIISGCGSGKTMIMLEAMARIGQKSCWICHSYELLNQTLERACESFEIQRSEIGIIAGGKVSIGNRLTMALVQTLARIDLITLKNEFGAVFIDEGHHVAARSFYETIGQFPSMYRLWASATPQRADGLEKVVYAVAGPILHTINQCELPTITPELKIIETDFSYHSDDYSDLISHLIKNDARNDLIASTVKEAHKTKGHYSLILSDRKEQLTTLKELLNQVAPNLNTEILTGSLSKVNRKEIMERVQRKEIDVLLCSQLAREGLDLIFLDRLFLVTPKKSEAAIIQTVGRVMRPAPGKLDAQVFDFLDSGSPILKSQWWRRRDAYQKLGIKAQWKKTTKQTIKQEVAS